jgi:hypothetical protein
MFLGDSVRWIKNIQKFKKMNSWENLVYLYVSGTYKSFLINADNS